jgi:hypothetical protein
MREFGRLSGMSFVATIDCLHFDLILIHTHGELLNFDFFNRGRNRTQWKDEQTVSYFNQI